MALKRSSEIITISGRYGNNTTGFTVQPVDLQLNPLDQEVFVVLGVQIDFLGNLPIGISGAAMAFNGTDEVALTTTRPSSQPFLSDSTCIAYAQRNFTQFNTADPTGPDGIVMYEYHERGPNDTPDTNMDYIAIIATDNFFVSGTDNPNNIGSLDVAFRMFGYRAKADAATYAALVQSEVLSS